MNVVMRNKDIFPNFIFILRHTSKSNKLRPIYIYGPNLKKYTSLAPKPLTRVSIRCWGCAYIIKTTRFNLDDNVLFYLHGDITMLGNYLATLFVILRVFS